MDNPGYVALSRQSGLMRELNTISNNIANLATNGYRREGAVFAEHVERLQNGDGSLSLAVMNRHFIDLSEGEVTKTGNPLDFAIEGQGFFLVETPAGQRLTRDGAFSLNAESELVNSSGARVLDESGGAILVPQGGKTINVTEEGVIFADGQAVSRIGVVASDAAALIREGANLFRANAEIEPVENARVRQFAIEGSNVSPVTELARLIEVQRTYEMGKGLTDNENDRIERTVRVLGQSQ